MLLEKSQSPEILGQFVLVGAGNREDMPCCVEHAKQSCSISARETGQRTFPTQSARSRLSDPSRKWSLLAPFERPLLSISRAAATSARYAGASSGTTYQLKALRWRLSVS